MVLKSNRSVLWRHIIETCRRPRWLRRKYSNNVARHDKIPFKSRLLSCNKNNRVARASYLVGVTLRCDFFCELQYVHFQFDHLCSVTTYSIICCGCRPIYCKTLVQWNSLIYTILKPWRWRHKPIQSSQRKLVCGSYSGHKIWIACHVIFMNFKMV